MNLGELGMLTIAIAALLVFAGMMIGNLIAEAKAKKKEKEAQGK